MGWQRFVDQLFGTKSTEPLGDLLGDQLVPQPWCNRIVTHLSPSRSAAVSSAASVSLDWVPAAGANPLVSGGSALRHVARRRTSQCGWGLAALGMRCNR